MTPVLRIAALAAAAAGITGCRLGPLVDDQPGASTNVLPPKTAVPLVTANADLANQIALNDGADDGDPGTVIPLGSGASGGHAVGFWSFGPTSRAPSPLYEFTTDLLGTPAGNLPLVDAVPGDSGYSPVHTLFRVLVTANYHGEVIPTVQALSDAIDLGLVLPPMSTGTFVASPIVLPETGITVDAGAPLAPEQVYADGFIVGMFRFGGALGVQPGGGLLPQNQVSFLRGPGGVDFDDSRPIFQATVPATMAPAGGPANYTPISVVVDVDVTVDPSTITNDDQLFQRTDGDISGLKSIVSQFQVTTQTLLLPLQFPGGMP